ncbi:MAG TPA: phospholipid carrier-dependent glycosyltransferase, partial [Polaromonas sp.]|nr:phospholipid carrier-dependent glycosyltransferase [Polaromonas sp.]
PYDLPFYTQAAKPMVVLQDWAQLRATAGDSWERELFESADFDAKAAKVLQSPEVLATAGKVAGNWLVMPVESGMTDGLNGWTLFATGAGWKLYRSGRMDPVMPSAAERPEAAQHKGLAGCKH